MNTDRGKKIKKNNYFVQYYIKHLIPEEHTFAICIKLEYNLKLRSGSGS